MAPSDITGSRQSLENAFHRLVEAVMDEAKPKIIDMYLEKYDKAHIRYMEAWSLVVP